MLKQFYFKQFNLALVNKVKWFQVLLCITNNSIKHQSFVYTQLNDQTVLLQIDKTLLDATIPGQGGPGSDWQ